MVHSSETTVLIIGAGPTGLTLACELARRGIQFRLIEKRKGPVTGSRARVVHPRTLEMFEDLGIIKSALAKGRLNFPLRIYDSKGRYQDRYLVDDYQPTPSAPHGASLYIPQFRVEEVLCERLKTLGGTVEFGTQFIKFEQQPDGVVATLATPQGRETVHAAWLVGCDSAHSLTRKQMGVNFVGETDRKARLLIGDFKVSGIGRTHWHVWNGIGVSPLPGTNISRVQVPISGDHNVELSLATFQRLLDERAGKKLRISDPSEMSVWRFNVRIADRYRVDRAFLAGDAAHTHPPSGGLGMNTGIHDAYNLGWKLAAVIKGADPKLLDTYEEERVPMAKWAMYVSTGIWKRIFGKRPFDHPQIVHMLGLSYRSYQLAQELRKKPHLIYAGDRAPDAPGLRTGTGEHRMFDLFRGTHFTVLAFGQRWNGVLKQIQASHGDRVKCVVINQGDPYLTSEVGLDVHDTLGHAYRGYDVDTTTGALFIIRPDGYIGLATEHLSKRAILQYLHAVVDQN